MKKWSSEMCGRKVISWILFLSWSLVQTGESLMCDRTTGMSVPKTPGNGRFEVIIQGGPGKYVPGAIYTVRIQGEGDPYGTEKFSRFLLVAEPAIGNAGQVSAGAFRLKDDSLARFSEFCPNAVKHASEVPKSDVEVLWIAPPVSAGCVIFRATVVKNNQQWYMDDDSLTEELCPEDEAQEEDDAEPCTACDEAKYELTFEGIWSSLTHPRHFPLNLWTANFSDIIGASHSPHFRFWDYGKLASEGLRQVAEFGDSRVLEGELKEESENIRTIIKARGLRHTNFNGLRTFAVFRADRTHNLISLVSKIDPSPDWFVGVSALNLCGKNGTWLVDKEINLFPIDAGTDSGASYMSPDMPTLPRVEIQRLVWSSNPESPFYDPDGNMLKPFAKLRLQQQRTYKRGSCDHIYQPRGSANDYDNEFRDESPDRDRPECGMHPWSPWSPCSPSCGKGIRRKTRRYINEGMAREFGCARKDVIERVCHNPQSCKTSLSRPSSGTFDETSRFGTGRQDQLNIYNVDSRPHYPDIRKSQTSGNPVKGNRKYYGRTEDKTTGEGMGDVCGTTEWRPWSICSDPCGTGVRYQTRSFLRPAQAKHHKCETHVKLKNTGRCPKTPECRESETPPQVEEGCEVTDWGPWRPCSVTCGKGVKTRDRLYKYATFDHRKCTEPMQETVPCDGMVPHCPPERTNEHFSNRPTWMRHSRPVGDNSVPYNYQYQSGTHPNRQTAYPAEHQPHSVYAQNPIGSHNLSPTLSSPQAGYYSRQTGHHPSYNDGPRVDCKLSPWSPWSGCSVSCGRGWKYQNRYVEVFNENGGRPCSPLLERSRRCRGMNCSRNSPHHVNGVSRNSHFDDYNYSD